MSPADLDRNTEGKKIMSKTLTAAVAAFLLAGAALATEHAVSQKGKAFSAETLDVVAGASVDFVNDDDVVHNIVVKGPDGQTQNSGSQKIGVTFTAKMAEKGEYEVRCGIHPKMKMTISAR